MHGENIQIGKHTRIFKNVIIASHPSNDYKSNIIIGDGCCLGESTHITCSNSIEIGDNLLTGRRVTITDNSHGLSSFTDMEKPPLLRQINSKGGIKIGNNVWIGDNAIILPGVEIGDSCIIGANCVVTKSIPSFCVVAGNPSKIVKELGVK